MQEKNIIAYHPSHGNSAPTSRMDCFVDSLLVCHTLQGLYRLTSLTRSPPGVPGAPSAPPGPLGHGGGVVPPRPRGPVRSPWRRYRSEGGASLGHGGASLGHTHRRGMPHQRYRGAVRRRDVFLPLCTIPTMSGHRGTSRAPARQTVSPGRPGTVAGIALASGSAIHVMLAGNSGFATR